jgi:hypothetical protein
MVDFIADRVTHFVSAPREYALLINGPWGVGKTYYCQKVLAPLIEARTGKRPSFVSLFGVSSIQDFDRRLIEGIAPLLTSSAAKVAGNAIGGALKKAFGIEFDPTALLDVLKGEVVFIDDLERSKLGIREIFGYIDNLITRYKIHAVVVGFEREFAESEPAYASWKEKLIGFTYEYRPDFSRVARDVITLNMGGEGAEWKAAILYEEYKSAFLERQEESPNFRTLRVATDAWSIIAEHLVEPTIKSRDAYKWMLWTILGVVTETRRNEALWPRLQVAFSSSFDINDFQLAASFRRAKHRKMEIKEGAPPLQPDPLEGFIDSWLVGAPSAVFHLKEVVNLLRTGDFDAKAFAEQLAELVNATNNAPPIEPVQRLFGHLWQLSDEDRHSTADAAIKEIDEDQITDVYQLVHLIDVLNFLAEERLIKYSAKEILDRGTDSLRRLHAHGRISAANVIHEIPKRMSHGPDSEALASFKSEALQVSHKVTADAKTAGYRHIFEGFSDPGHTFNDIGRDGRHMTEPVFAIVPTDVVIGAIDLMPTQKLADLITAVTGRYSYSNVRDFMMVEAEALATIGKALRSRGEQTSSPRSLRDYQIEKLGEQFLAVAKRLAPEENPEAKTPNHD